MNSTNKIPDKLGIFSVSQFLLTVQSTALFYVGGYPLVAHSLLSIAQEDIDQGNMVKADQMIERAKLIMTTMSQQDSSEIMGQS